MLEIGQRVDILAFGIIPEVERHAAKKITAGALEVLHLALTFCGVPIYCNKIFNIPVAPYTHSAISGLDGVGWMVSGWGEV